MVTLVSREDFAAWCQKSLEALANNSQSMSEQELKRPPKDPLNAWARDARWDDSDDSWRVGMVGDEVQLDFSEVLSVELGIVRQDIWNIWMRMGVKT